MRDYEYVSIQPLDPGVPEDHSTPQKKAGPAAPNALSHELQAHANTGTSAAFDISPTGDED